MKHKDVAHLWIQVEGRSNRQKVRGSPWHHSAQQVSDRETLPNIGTCQNDWSKRRNCEAARGDVLGLRSIAWQAEKQESEYETLEELVRATVVVLFETGGVRSTLAHCTPVFSACRTRVGSSRATKQSSIWQCVCVRVCV